MGNVILGEHIEKSFKIQNISNFKIDFNLLTIAEGLRNKNRNEVLYFKNNIIYFYILHFLRLSFLSLPKEQSNQNKTKK